MAVGRALPAAEPIMPGLVCPLTQAPVRFCLQRGRLLRRAQSASVAATCGCPGGVGEGCTACSWGPRWAMTVARGWVQQRLGALAGHTDLPSPHPTTAPSPTSSGPCTAAGASTPWVRRGLFAALWQRVLIPQTEGPMLHSACVLALPMRAASCTLRCLLPATLTTCVCTQTPLVAISWLGARFPSGTPGARRGPSRRRSPGCWSSLTR